MMEHEATSYGLPKNDEKTMCNGNLMPIIGENLKSHSIVDTADSIMPELMYIPYNNPINKTSVGGFVNSNLEAQPVCEDNRVTTFKLRNIVQLSAVDNLELQERNSVGCQYGWTPKLLLENRLATNHGDFHNPSLCSLDRTYNSTDEYQGHHLSNTRRNNWDTSSNEQESYNSYTESRSGCLRGYR